MVSLSEYIIEFVSSGRKRNLHSEFPKQPDIEAIANFLEYNGFEKYDGPLTLARYSNYYKKDAYEIGFRGKLLKMYKKEDNAVFCIWLEERTDTYKYYGNFGNFAFSGPSNINQVFYNTYDEFREAVIDHYGW